MLDYIVIDGGSHKANSEAIRILSILTIGSQSVLKLICRVTRRTAQCVAGYERSPYLCDCSFDRDIMSGCACASSASDLRHSGVFCQLDPQGSREES